jgi:hypothetical protein
MANEKMATFYKYQADLVPWRSARRNNPLYFTEELLARFPCCHFCYRDTHEIAFPVYDQPAPYENDRRIGFICRGCVIRYKIDSCCEAEIMKKMAQAPVPLNERLH